MPVSSNKETLLYTLGDDYSRDETTFGRIINIVPRHDGSFYLLDGMSNDIRLFGDDGSFQGLFGRSGEGPNELRDPVSLVRHASGVLAVATRSSIKAYRGHGAELEFVRSIPVGDVPSPRDACVVGDTYYVRAHDRQRGTVVTAVSSNGSVLGYFGEGYKAGSWLVQRQLSDGPIVCTESNVIVGFHSLPDIRAYATSGVELWRARISGFVPGRVLESRSTDGSEQVQSLSDQVEHRVLGIAVGPRSTVLVHVAALGPADGDGRQDMQGVRTYLIHASTGSSLQLKEATPYIVAVDSTRMYALDMDPRGAPLVRVYAIGSPR